MPTRSAIAQALKNPQRSAPAIERLGGGWIVAGDDGTLRSRHTNDAMVVRLDRDNGQAIALKVPLADDGDEGALRIHAAFAGDRTISALRAISPSPIAGGVSVVSRGIVLTDERSGSGVHPVIAMEWIGDLTLGDLVRRLISANDLVRLGGLGTRFVRLKQALTEHHFSHGSLTPDNIVMRRGDAMAIVDYDTAAWPGSPRGRMAATTPAYGHPSGTSAAVLERRDDFASLVVLVSLRALAIDTGMLFPASLHPEHGLVLSARDLHDPRHSDRFRRLAMLDDPETVALAAILAEACQKQIDHVPPFEEAIRAAKAVTGRVRRSGRRSEPPAEPSQEPERASNTLSSRDKQLRMTRLNALLMAGVDEDVIAYWESSGLADDPAAIEQVGDFVHEARLRLDRLKNPPPPEPEPPRHDPRGEWRVVSTGASMARLEQALVTGDRVTVLREWDDVRDVPGASRFAANVHQIAADYWSGAIQHAARRDDATSVLEIVERADQAGVPIPAGLRPLVREARTRVATAEDAISDEPVNWESHLPLLARAVREEDDRAIVTALAWEREDVLDAVPEPFRSRVVLGMRRIEWADMIRDALRRHDETAIERLSAQPVPGAMELLGSVERARIERGRERKLAQDQLNDALRGTSNRDFVRAMRRLEACAAPLPADLDHAAFIDAIDRITRLSALRRAATDPEKDARAIARLVPAALTGGADWATVERLVNLEDVDRELIKSARVVRIREALATGSDQAIAAAAMPDPHDVLPELSELEREQVEAALNATKPLAGRKSFMADPGKQQKQGSEAGPAVEETVTAD